MPRSGTGVSTRRRRASSRRRYAPVTGRARPRGMELRARHPGRGSLNAAARMRALSRSELQETFAAARDGSHARPDPAASRRHDACPSPDPRCRHSRRVHRLRSHDPAPILHHEELHLRFTIPFAAALALAACGVKAEQTTETGTPTEPAAAGRSSRRPTPRPAARWKCGEVTHFARSKRATR